LRADIRLLELTDDKVAEGTYTLAWDCGKRWRAQIDFGGGYQDVQIVNEGKLWRQSTMNQEPVRMYELRQVLEFASRLTLLPRETGKSVRSRSEEESPTHCVELRAGPVPEDQPPGEIPRVLCFDADVGTLLREERPHLTNAFMDYAPWGSGLFPRTLLVFEDDTLVVEVREVELTAFPDPDPSWFLPPDGAEWVFLPGAGKSITHPKLIHQVLPEYTSEATRKGIEGDVFIEGIVTAEGKVVLVRLAKRLPDNDLNTRAMESVLQWRFEPARKDGRPVPVVSLFKVTFQIHARR